MKHYVFNGVSPTRSKTMRAIKGKDTALELRLRKALFARGLRYRLHKKTLPGKPDIVFPSSRLAVFCDSEFWHGKNWRLKKDSIRSNRSYWIAKIENNIDRDRQVNRKLKRLGWRVLRFWEKDIISNLQDVVNKIEKAIYMG